MNFVDMEVNLTEEEQQQVMKSYVRGALLPESQEKFRMELDGGSSMKDALYAAVFNDCCVRILLQEIEVVEEENATTK